jgi:hypothetical protein
MSMILSWVFFPLVLAAIGLGWGAIVQWCAGDRELGPLTIPLGLAAGIVVAGALTAFSLTAPIAAPVTAIGALAGVVLSWRRVKLGAAPAVAAIGVLLIYGAPVILSGEATFLGYVRLDDTATWFNLTDWLFSHGRSFPYQLSTYQLLAKTNLGTVGGDSAYPSGAFMLLGVGHWVTQIDIAWIFQPYLAGCASALALSIYGLTERVLEWRWLRAFVAFIAAQSALLFGYAAWGGIKELTSAFLVALVVALVARLLAAEELHWRDMVGPAVAGGALMLTIGPGSEIYGAPLIAVLYLYIVWRAADGESLRPADGAVARLGGLAALVAVLAAVGALWFKLGFTDGLRYALAPGIFVSGALLLLVIGARRLLRVLLLVGSILAGLALFGFPLWLLLPHYLSVDQGSFNAGNTVNTTLGNLAAPLRALQISGIWPAGDFRDVGLAPFTPPAALPRYGFAYLTFLAGAGGAIWTLWRRRPEIAIYALIAVVAVALPWLDGITPWLVGKALAISSPAILLAGLVGGALLFSQDRTWALVAGAVVLVGLGAGVLWSNWLQYRNVTLAPRDQLSELQTIGSKLAGKGPTFINEYQIYADRHFLRAGAPTEPAEYRYGPQEDLPTVTGAILTKSAFADIDSFPLSTLRPYRSLVLRNSPVESEPPSIYGTKPVWQGRYYQLWQQPAHPTHRVIEHVALGDTNLDYCGSAENETTPASLCSIQPAAVDPCPSILTLARVAAQDGGELLAYERANPIVLRGTQTRWPDTWAQDGSGVYAEDALTATTPGTAVAHVNIPTGRHRFELWLGGGFDRGFVVHVDGHLVGSVSNELNNLGEYNQVGAPITLSAGVHTIDITYPQPNLSPGDADSESYTSLAEIALQQLGTPQRMLEVTPANARELCGKTLDWIEVVAPVRS